MVYLWQNMIHSTCEIDYIVETYLFLQVVCDIMIDDRACCWMCALLTLAQASYKGSRRPTGIICALKL